MSLERTRGFRKGFKAFDIKQSLWFRVGRWYYPLAPQLSGALERMKQLDSSTFISDAERIFGFLQDRGFATETSDRTSTSLTAGVRFRGKKRICIDRPWSPRRVRQRLYYACHWWKIYREWYFTWISRTSLRLPCKISRIAWRFQGVQRFIIRKWVVGIWADNLRKGFEATCSGYRRRFGRYIWGKTSTSV